MERERATQVDIGVGIIGVGGIESVVGVQQQGVVIQGVVVGVVHRIPTSHKQVKTGRTR